MTESTQQFFTACPESVGEARDFATATVFGWGRSDRAEDIRLCVSELASNALRHGTIPGRGFLVRLDADDEGVGVEVHDSRRQQPSLRRPADTDTSGRGLILVAALCDGWGVEHREATGKVVWAYFKTGPAAAP